MDELSNPGQPDLQEGSKPPAPFSFEKEDLGSLKKVPPPADLNRDSGPTEIQPQTHDEDEDEDGEVREREQEVIEKLAKPFWFTRMVAKGPVFFLLFRIFTMITISSIVYFTGAGNLTPSYYRDYLVWGDEKTKVWDMKRIAENQNSDFENGIQPLRTVEQGMQKIFITFEGRSWIG